MGWEEEKEELPAGPGHCELASPEAPSTQVRWLPWGLVLTSLLSPVRKPGGERPPGMESSPGGA